ncbi:MAG: hypothetical protein Q8Q14_06755 [Gemmatimonadales bacterium]|nr:hypothetical protein [Gemmatimonadales bacterium]
MRLGTCAAACALAVSPLAAQDSTRSAHDSALRVFLDCPDTFCDFDYYRTEITFVNWVRDREYAQVHVLITTQSTGGGREYTLTFIGLERFAGATDTLRYISRTGDTEDGIRTALARSMRLGLVRFAARTPVGPRIQILYSAPAGAACAVRDPWDYWVFNVGINSNFFGEKSYQSTYLSGNISASRITAEWKIRLALNESYSRNDFVIPVFDTAGAQTGEETITNVRRDYNANGLIVRSLGAHWSAGARASAYASTYSNQDLTLRFGPALEYDIFPYSQSTRKLLTIQYGLNVAIFNYRDTTIFNKLGETLANQSLAASLNVKQPWGSAGLSVEGSHYLHDFSKNRLEFYGDGNLRLYKGLSFDFWGYVELIHDQLAIEKGTATEQEVLLRRRQLATSYQYGGFIGLRYTFGSKYANIVNPRFGNRF